MDTPIDDLEGGHRRTAAATWCTIFYAWFSFLFWTVTILLLIFGISLYALLRSNLPDVQVHRLDVYKLNVTEPKNKNKDTQLAIDVQILVNVTNNNKKMALVYGGMSVETMVEGFSLPKVHVDGFRQKAKTTRDLKIHPKEMRSAVNDDDAREMKLSASQHQMALTVKMKGKIEFWYNGRLVSKLGLNVLCDNVEQSQIDQALAPECNVKLSFFRYLPFPFLQ